ncbi:DUF814-domain-containing protein [Myriangium duriaei CBS 260.36]|uniref:DUF814-domain-containing protein n=1 Tax=Myriangium duriaei CBS 260.36 TaxID=1168546 RepID=A0A9P4MG24_9PEZI|nr:DUF814-domain-containing protein [Myriangium duriaei CBS 260.36]
MVLYFTSNVVQPSAYIYMGKDKFENEDLIKFGWEEDVWFHVDNLSSAHVYVRMREGETWDKIEPALLTDCAQLTKANSIEGNKKDNITVIYTPWSNLKKDGSMATGQVSFHDQRKVKRIHVEKRENVIVNRLNKTKAEKHPDLKQEKSDRERELRKRDQKARQERVKEEARVNKERKELKYQREHAYDDWNDEDAVHASSNQDRAADWEDDFM